MKAAPAPWMVRVFVVLFIGFHTAVPLYQLHAPRPSRMGWHMFTAVRPVPTFEVVTAHGSRPIPRDEWVAKVRYEADFARYVPPHLCRRYQGRAVIVRTAAGTENRVECK